MADMHIIAGGGGGFWKVAMHFPIPDVVNNVGVNYRTALVNSGLASVSVLDSGAGTEGTISAAEEAQLAAGEVFEHIEDMFLDGPGMTDAIRVALLKTEYAKKDSEVLAELQQKLKFFGHNQAKA